MNWILCAISFLFLLVVFIAFTMYRTLGKISRIKKSSQYILNRFEPDNTASKLTDLIEFHKVTETVKYTVD